jgi:hypothetical protein
VTGVEDTTTNIVLMVSLAKEQRSQGEAPTVDDVVARLQARGVACEATLDKDGVTCIALQGVRGLIRVPPQDGNRVSACMVDLYAGDMIDAVRALAKTIGTALNDVHLQIVDWIELPAEESVTSPNATAW